MVQWFAWPKRSRRPQRRGPYKRLSPGEQQQRFDLQLQRAAVKTFKDVDPDGYRDWLLDKARHDLGMRNDRGDRGRGGRPTGNTLLDLANSELAAGLGESLGQYLGGIIGRGASPSGAALPPPLPAAQPPAQQQPPAPVPVAPPPPPVVPPPSETMESRYLRSLCESRGPSGAAAWLIASPDQRAQQIVSAVVALPDARLGELWATLRQQAPGLDPFIAWFLTWPHHAETVQAIRVLHAQQPAASGQPAQVM